MSRVQTMPITDEQLSDLIKAIGLRRSEIAALCGVGTQAPGWWRFKGRIPLIHFRTLSAALEKRLKRRKELTPLEQRAALFCKALHAGTIDAKNNRKARKNSPINARSQTAETARRLDLVSLEDLINELGRRGGTVTFDKKKIVVK